MIKRTYFPERDILNRWWHFKFAQTDVNRIDCFCNGVGGLATNVGTQHVQDTDRSATETEFENGI